MCLAKNVWKFFSNFVWDEIEAIEEKIKTYCAPLTSRHFNRYLFIERKQEDCETVLDYVHVSPGDQGSVFTGKVDGERTEFGENITSSLHR